ncbi:urease accessory protein UreF [Rhodobacteraceae bacterium]|nr:urease accessory protein UreF [Paracoccaceae bacterium]
MADLEELLSLVQWLSPAFPTGAYAYSHGLEQAIAAGDVTNEADLAQVLGDILAHGAGWSEAILLARGLAGGDLAVLDATARALCASAERLRETTEQGCAFQRARAQMTGATEGDPLTLPVAVAQAARALDLDADAVIGVYLHAFASNLTLCAVRFVPLGQAQGQRVLAGLHPLVCRLARAAVGAELSDLRTCAFRADMAAMAHETLDVRIFKT